MSQSRRPLWARLALVALNLPFPGVGLLRTAEPRIALALLLLAPGAMLLMLGFYAAVPTLTFTAYVVSGGLLLLATLVAIVASMWLSWRSSGHRAEEELPWWRRWYGLAIAAALLILLSSSLVAAAHSFYKPFYLPAEAMAPTLLKDDRLIASMRPPSELRRGDVILFRVGKFTYIKRLAALPGDRIALESGTVILNGSRVDRKTIGTESVEGSFGPVGAIRLRERFPGEAAPHEIYDMGPYPLDDMAEVEVSPGHVFVLGDNRDHSADSRVPRDQMGVEQLPVGDILGKALFHTWGPSGRMGQPISR